MGRSVKIGHAKSESPVTIDRNTQYVTDGQDHALGLDIGFAVRGRLDRIDERLSGVIPLEPSEFIGGDDHDLGKPRSSHDREDSYAYHLAHAAA